METIKSLRVSFREWTGDELVAETTDNRLIRLICNEKQQNELRLLADYLAPGNIFNLLNFSESEGSAKAEFLVFEPDYLLDVSALAECFKPYGHHPLNYILARLRLYETSAAILLGNVANFFVDEFVYEDPQRPVEFAQTLNKLFHTAAFEFTACGDLQQPKQEAEFFDNCRKHFHYIQHIVNQVFPSFGIHKENIILEPAFVSNALGLQGRLDILLDNYSQFIELKSGRAVENFRDNNSFTRSAENHYIQMTLYLAILEFNLDLTPDAIRSYLLYSKYPILNREKHERYSLRMALSLRNRIVANEYSLQKANDPCATRDLLLCIHSKILNTKRMSGTLFDQFLAPAIDRLPRQMERLSELERSYFLQLYTFITKELWISKAGERDYEGLKKAANLWNAPFNDKLLTGEILYDLLLLRHLIVDDRHSIVLAIPEYKDLYLPNFRTGDAVILYERTNDGDTVNNRQVFKATIEAIEGRELRIRLRFRQKNPHVWKPQALYAIEHDYMDTSYGTMFRGLCAFLYANPDRREMLLHPWKGDDISLIVGPPGTGKTSVALRQLVVQQWNADASLLLLAYTNRAVDEICKTLTEIEPPLPFIRIGSELNCAPEYRPYLHANRLADCENRVQVEETLRGNRIFVGTASSIGNKPELFQLKHFELVIVDEATQLLEPHLLNIFCGKNPDGRNAADRFVLIGDHKQLPAVVLQTREDSRVNDPSLHAIGLKNLGDSLFERLHRKYKAEGRTDLIRFLSKQGRMHPDIAAFPSKYFYDNLLESLDLPHQKEQWTDRKRLNFHSVQPHADERSNKTNRGEAEQVAAICLDLYRQSVEEGCEFQAQSIGIITPFRNQIALIRRVLHETGVAAFSEIMVDTVERFQGSQREVIIYSFCIRSENQLESLPNWLEEEGRTIDRKLNVALTRARKQLHLVGNRELLMGNGVYRRLIEEVEEG